MWGLSSLTRDQTRIPLQWECGVLTTGPQGRLEVLFKKKKERKKKGPSENQLGEIYKGDQKNNGGQGRQGEKEVKQAKSRRSDT